MKRKRKTRGGAKDACSKCGGLLESNRHGKYRYCLKCHRDYNRNNRPKKGRKKYGIKIKCSKCGGSLELDRIGIHRWCRECHRKNARKNRKKHFELNPEQKKRANARSYANQYLKRGYINKMPCEVCGNVNVQMHHDDYDKPTQVRWLCRKHHRAEHGHFKNKEYVIIDGTAFEKVPERNE